MEWRKLLWQARMGQAWQHLFFDISRGIIVLNINSGFKSLN